jgi:hypothetical protein
MKWGPALLLMLLAVAAASFAARINSESTACYGRFESPADAEAVKRQIEAKAPGIDLDMDSEKRGGKVSVTFRSGESGSDAEELRRAFRPAVRAHGGKLGHPGDGCLERGFFM